MIRIALALFPLVVAGVLGTPAAAENETIRIIGSGYTVLPIVRKWIAAFREIEPDVIVEALGEGTSMGPAALISGRAQIAAMSRPMSLGEITVFVERRGHEPLGFPVGVDAIAIYVNTANPLEEITLPQLDAIYSETRRCGASKALKKWGDLGIEGELAEQSIRRYGRRAESGTGSYFQTAALCGGVLRGDMIETAGGGAVAKVISQEAVGIGFGGRPTQDQGARIVALAPTNHGPFLLPEPANVRSGQYPMTRQLVLYTGQPPGKPLAPGVAAFLRFALSPAGQAIVEDAGFLSATPESRADSLKRIP
jgi:phosphate transport system substrate-binding protein